MMKDTTETRLEQGLLVLDYENIRDEAGVFFDDLKFILPQIAQQKNIEIVLLVPFWKDTIGEELDATFGEDRTFLHTSTICNRQYYEYSVGEVLDMKLSKGLITYSKEQILFVGSHESIKTALKRQFPTLPILNDKDFFKINLIEACHNTFGLVDRITALPEETTFNISQFLNLMACVNFHSVNREMHRRHSQSNLLNKPNYSLFTIQDFDKTVMKIISKIKIYITTNKSQCNFMNWQSDRGYKRAIAFTILFSNKNACLGFKLFGLYALLEEKNGTKFKKTIKTCLPDGIELTLKKILLIHYGMNEKKLSETLGEFYKIRDDFTDNHLDYFLDVNNSCKIDQLFPCMFGNFHTALGIESKALIEDILINPENLEQESLGKEKNSTCTIS